MCGDRPSLEGPPIPWGSPAKSFPDDRSDTLSLKTPGVPIPPMPVPLGKLGAAGLESVGDGLAAIPKPGGPPKPSLFVSVCAARTASFPRRRLGGKALAFSPLTLPPCANESAVLARGAPLPLPPKLPVDALDVGGVGDKLPTACCSMATATQSRPTLPLPHAPTRKLTSTKPLTKRISRRGKADGSELLPSLATARNDASAHPAAAVHNEGKRHHQGTKKR